MAVNWKNKRKRKAHPRRVRAAKNGAILCHGATILGFAPVPPRPTREGDTVFVIRGTDGAMSRSRPPSSSRSQTAPCHACRIHAHGHVKIARLNGVHGVSRNPLIRLVRKALEEDVGPEDLTTKLTVPKDAHCRAVLVAKQEGRLSGMKAFRAVFRALRAGLDDWEAFSDGDTFRVGDKLAAFSGRTRAILTGERTAMNFVQHLSGIASLTAAYVEAAAGFRARICDTRKTTPLLRVLEKEAVVHGGGSNHRHSLFDGILIKENHIAAAGGIGKALALAAAGAHHLMKIEIEVRTMAEFEEAVDAGAEAILLDNMGLDDMARAAETVKDRGVVLEASGNITLERIRPIAETGVHFISVGALTHSAPAADFSLLITRE